MSWYVFQVLVQTSYCHGTNWTQQNKHCEDTVSASRGKKKEDISTLKSKPGDETGKNKSPFECSYPPSTAAGRHCNPWQCPPKSLRVSHRHPSLLLRKTERERKPNRAWQVSEDSRCLRKGEIEPPQEDGSRSRAWAVCSPLWWLWDAAGENSVSHVPSTNKALNGSICDNQASYS